MGDQSCWDSTITPVSETFPMLVTESGFKIDYVQKLWPWLEKQGISYMAWTWNTWSGEGLVTDWQGTPSNPWGAAWKAQLAAAPSPQPSPAPSPSPSPPSCPGGSLSACMNLCPTDPTAFQTCVRTCEQRCSGVSV